MLTLQVYPGKSLGFLTLGSSLHDVLTRLKSQPQTYPNIDISYSPRRPLEAPVVLNLPLNGFRLRFDGPEQRLRLIEILDFRKTQLTYKNVDFVKLSECQPAVADRPRSQASGPAFRHVYNMMGPTFPGEYVPPETQSASDIGLYILSYPGIAFTFPLQNSAWNPNKDHVSLLSSSAAQVVRSFAIFDGPSWQATRQSLFERDGASTQSPISPYRSKDHRADEVEIIRILGNGKLEVIRRSSPPFHIKLSETTAQDLVTELGPPDAIYRKNDRRLSIHRSRRQSSKQRQNSSSSRDEDLTDTDKSSMSTSTDDSDIGDDSPGPLGEKRDDLFVECFYNYFYHGLDIFMSYPTKSSLPFPTSAVANAEHQRIHGTDYLVATKVLLHGNVPGSYPFNRYRRVRWEIDTGDPEPEQGILDSESSFTVLSESLQRIWQGKCGSESEELSLRKGMVLNRGWGDSPGSSCELLGGWEESADTQRKENNVMGGPGSGNTELFGFPGLIFEVLKNEAVSCLTVY